MRSCGEDRAAGEFARNALAVNLQLRNAAVNLQRFAMLALRGICRESHPAVNQSLFNPLPRVPQS